MSASKLHPNIYNGEERSGGYLVKNSKPTSAASPDWKGRVYLEGVGWYWISGWWKAGRKGEVMRISPQEMTDEQAEKYCVPKAAGQDKPTTNPVKTRTRNGAGSQDSDIPF